MMIPDWASVVLNVSVLVMLVACLDTLHAIKREQRRLQRQHDAPMVEAQERPRLKVAI